MDEESWGPYKDYIAKPCNTSDGNIAVAYSYADSMAGPYNSYSHIRLTKFDNQGNEVFDKIYGNADFDRFVHNVVETGTGDLIIVGYVLNYPPWNVGWIMKVTGEGDSLWYREYNYLEGNESRNRLYDVVEIADGRIAACGQVRPYHPDTGSFDTWVLMLDSLGCEFEGCDTIVSVRELAFGELDFEIYPNPAIEQITVVLNNNGYSELRITNINGQLVYQEHNRGRDNSIQVSVRNWQKGIYIVQVRSSDGLFKCRKLIVK